MAAMTISTPVALAGARPTKATLSRRAVASRASTKAPVSVARGALQVRAAIALDYNAETPMTYNETGKWRENFDLAAWASEVRQVEKDLKAEIGEDDVDHLNKILTWANMLLLRRPRRALRDADAVRQRLRRGRRREPDRGVHDVHRDLRAMDDGRASRLPRRVQHRAERGRGRDRPLPPSHVREGDRAQDLGLDGLDDARGVGRGAQPPPPLPGASRALFARGPRRRATAVARPSRAGLSFTS
jgi:hypothetical protein